MDWPKVNSLVMMSSIVPENSGTIDNYMGDGVLAVFGINKDPNPAHSAV